MAAQEVGNSYPDCRFKGESFLGGAWHLPAPDIKRYHGYMADMYHSIDEMRRWKRKWYDGRDAYVLKNPDNLQGDEGDRRKQWAKTVDAQDAAGMEQWEQRQAVAYAAAAQSELMRLQAAGISVLS